MTDFDDRPPFGPLAGIRVLDLAVAQAGQSATMMLADLGAEIIKVESLEHYQSVVRGPRHPPAGDDARSRSARRNYPDMDPGPDPWNRLSWFNCHARNKRAITLNFSAPRGREIFLRLVAMSDGLVENLPAGRLERFGLAPETLLEANPGFITVRLAPLGLWGPDAKSTGFGWHFEQLAGYTAVQGYREGPSVSSTHMDGASGPAGASAFLMALLRRSSTGRGGVVEVSQLENMINHIGDVVMQAALRDEDPARLGNHDRNFAPQGAYRCVGEERWLALTIRDDDEWATFVRVLGDPPDLRDPAFKHVEGRRASHDRLDELISAQLAGRSRDDMFHLLQRHGIAAGPVMDEADAYADPQLRSRGFFHRLEHRRAGTHRYPGAIFHMSETPPEIRRAAPVVGQDNEYVYRKLLGVSDEEYAELVREGHIGTEFGS